MLMIYLYYLSILCHLPFGSLSGNEVDSIASEEAANAFIEQVTGKDYYKIAGDSLLWSDLGMVVDKKFEKWHVSDVNNDGLNDLVANIKSFSDLQGLVILGALDGHYQYRTFVSRRFDSRAGLRWVGEGDTQLELTRLHRDPLNKPDTMYAYQTVVEIDTLVFKYGAFLSMSRSFFGQEIKKVSLSTMGCFGTCPKMEIEIKESGEALLKAIAYNDKMHGIYQGSVAPGDWERICEIIDYVNPQLLHETYSVPWTDDQTYKLTIVTKDNRRFTIEDYGGLGDVGLEVLYGELLDLRFSQQWKRISKRVK